MNRKGALSLSITAIVVIVIAFVVLGLALTLTRTIFKGAQEKLPEAFAVTQLESEPTPGNPITIPDRVEIGRGDTKELTVGYYNTDPNSHDGVFLTVTGCKASAEEAQTYLDTNIDTLPSITSIEQKVGPSEAVAYKVILTENDLLGGFNYICTIAAASEVGGVVVSHQAKQFFLYVTA